MTTGATAPPRMPTPRPYKAPATSSLTPESVAASTPSNTPETRAPSRAVPGLVPGAGPRRVHRAGASDPLSDRATTILIRRILCPEQQLDKGRTTPVPVEDLLPPLTSRNDVDLQLYAIIAIILREYVQKWYSKITPDETFVAETVQIIAHCTRAIEQRLRKVDLESLLFNEIPDLLDKHVNTYRAAHGRVAQPPVQTDPREIYHSLCPLPALTPVPKFDAPSAIVEQAENEAAYRQLLVQGVLALLLPTEDLENGCLTALVGQIFSELIIGNIVANRLAEPWLIWEGFIILSGLIRRRTSDPSAQYSTRSRRNFRPTSARRSFSVHGLFLTLLQWCFFAVNLARLLVTEVVSSRSIPRRTRYGASHGDEMTRQKTAGVASNPVDVFETHAGPVMVPVLAFRIWPAISNLIEMDTRMPWLCGALSFLQWTAMTGPGRIADVDGILDRYLSHSVIHAHVLDAAMLPPLLRTIRGALFPNNAPGTSNLRAPSSESELRALRRRCANALWALVPKSLGNIYFGGDTGKRSSWWWWLRGVWSPRVPGAVSTGNRQYQRSVAGGVKGDRDQGSVVGHQVTRTHLAPGPRTGPGPLTPTLARSGPTNNASADNGSDDRSEQPGLAQSSNGGGAVSVGGGPSQTAQKQDNADTQQHGEDEEVRRAAAQVPVGWGDGDGGEEGGGADCDREDEERILSEIETGIVDVFDDAYCNKHLMYGIIELVLVRLMPELAEKGVIDLWEERLN